MVLELVKPSLELKIEHLKFIKEWEDHQEDITPYAVRLNEKEYSTWLEDNYKMEDISTCPSDWVPASTYFLINKDRRILGAVNIRHDLNEFLINYGGHIGYGIRPSERRKGYATKILKEALQIARNEIGLEKVLVTCDQTNRGSRRTIQKNGGVLENEVIWEGAPVQRYWIQLK